MVRSQAARTAQCALRGSFALILGGVSAISLTAASHAASGDVAQPVLALPSLVQANAETRQSVLFSEARQGASVFSQAYYQDTKFDFDHIAADTRINGFSLGAAYALGDLITVGGVLDRSDVQIRTHQAMSQDYVATTLSGFVRLEEDGHGLTASVSRSWLDFDRGVRATGANGVIAESAFDGSVWLASLESDLTVNWSSLDLTMINGIHYTRVRLDGADETGATGLALGYGKQSINGWRFDSALHVAAEGWQVTDALHLRPVGRVSWSWRSNGDHSLTRELLDGSANPVTLKADGLAEHSFETELGLEARIADRFTAALSYGRGWGDDRHSDDRVNLILRMPF